MNDSSAETQGSGAFSNQAPDPDLQRLAGLAALMDNRFRIPGTQIRFGLDAIIGLVPYVGDIAGLIIGAYMMLLVARRGAGPLILLQMGANYLVDTLVGAIPVLGDLFDIAFKANRRNLQLLQAYYASGKPRPNTLASVLILILLFFAILAAALAAAWWAATTLIGSIFGL